MDNKFYVYIYLDPRYDGVFKYGDYTFDYRPFYVGKGCGSRDVSHIYEAENHKNINRHKCILIRKILKESTPIVLRVCDNMTDADALELESVLIKLIGRKCDGGILTNHGECGRVMSGVAHPLYGKKRSEETKEKIRNTLKGRPLSEETKKKLSLKSKGVGKTKEHAENISKGKKGIATVKHTDATKELIAASQRGILHHSSKTYTFIIYMITLMIIIYHYRLLESG
jgi:hypothetical protein